MRQQKDSRCEQNTLIITLDIDGVNLRGRKVNGFLLQVMKSLLQRHDSVVAQVQPQSIHKGMDVAMFQQHSIFKNRPSTRP